MIRRDGAYDVIVVGAGVLGTFHAYFACLRGLRTLLIERGDAPNEASVRNFGTIVPSAMTPGDWHRRALETTGIYRGLAKELPPFLQTGGTQYLALSPAEMAVLEEFSKLGPDRGYACRLLGRRESVELNPAVNPSNCLGSLHFPDDLRVDPPKLFAHLLPWMRRSLDCRYMPNTVVAAVESDGGDCLVTTAAGECFTGRHVFVCTGADFRTLYPRLFAESGLTRCRLQMLRTHPMPKRITTTVASGLSIRWYPSFQMCDSWNQLRGEPVDDELALRGIHVLVVQDDDGRMVVGDSHEYSAGDFPVTLDARTEQLILREAGRMVDLPDGAVAERWHGIYALHPERPVFTATFNDSIHVVTGIGGKGMTTGPAFAREAIDRITECRRPSDEGLTAVVTSAAPTGAA